MPAPDFTVLERRETIEALPDPAAYSVLRRLIEDENNKVVVGFGGGALPGICGNAALASLLEDLDLRKHVEEIWGTSAGAITGGTWASGNDAQIGIELARGLQGRSLDFKMMRFGLGVFLSLWPFRRPLPDGLITGEVLLQTIEQGLRVETFEECTTPFRCIACSDDGRANRKIFRRGPLLPAIFASMSIPGVVVPRELADGNAYYDGGLIEKSPLLSPIADHLRSGDKRKLVLICTHFGNEVKQSAKDGLFHRFMHTLYAMEEQVWHYQLEEARQREDVILLLLNPHLGDTQLFNFANTDLNYLNARERFGKILQNARIVQTFGLT